MLRALAGLLIAIVCCSAATASAEELVDGIAAQVGEDVVLISEVMRRVGPTEKRMVEAGAPESEIAKLRAQGLERMIESRLVDQEMRRRELFATDEEVDQAIEAIAAENGITVQQLVDSVHAQGMPFEEYREELRSKVQQRKVMTAMLAPRVTIEEDELRRLYQERFSKQPEGGEQVHLRQLLVPAGPDTSLDASCEAVEGAAARIRDGEAFEVVASKVSAVSPGNGGDIGWLHVDTLASWMAKLIQPLKPGEVSGVTRQPFGCNLLKLVERREFEPVTYEVARERLYQEVFQLKMEAEFMDWMDELRKHTYIKRGGYFAEAAQLDDPSAKDPANHDSLFQ